MIIKWDSRSYCSYCIIVDEPTLPVGCLTNSQIIFRVQTRPTLVINVGNCPVSIIVWKFDIFTIHLFYIV